MSTLFQASLFEDPQPPLAAELAPRLASLANQGIYLGTSSWKYEGWIGQIYSREKYLTRGRFSQKRFETECLNEYAKTFPVVCGDFSFYQFPSEAYWQHLFATSPPSLLYAFKVPEEITVLRYPIHDRYGARAGTVNETFLDANVFYEMFLRHLLPYRDRIASLIFEFTAFHRNTFDDRAPFPDQLDAFFKALPEGFRYSVEIRNPEFLTPEYFGSLRAHNAAHVFNAWSRMPDLTSQTTLPGAFTADFTVVRALLRRGRPYDEAVKAFAPYLHVQDPNPETRDAIRVLIRRSTLQRERAFIFVNNRLEGNAPESIHAIISDSAD